MVHSLLETEIVFEGELSLSGIVVLSHDCCTMPVAYSK